ncbi:response regulator transcription factor [Nonomuraea soli]|uniref:DNA-binding response OmpR family regulator n=1 Tax=Nonomuraea soli TaxID=1032476 RepID=A0A7W0CQK5_9ACTN|nr:response regulator transcription factor [Nonomuraea soli]MBA2895383.1 DNA-binding response OmpR family regulator [Nonomuraea soli]
MSTRILVVDDDLTVAEVVTRYLERDGHEVEHVGDGAEALRRAMANPPDLMILDLMLPKVDGLKVCEKLRERWPVPVIMLTALGEETDRIAGLETGADDYMVKPFSPRELALRVQSVLRRARGAAPATGVLRDADLVVDVGARQAHLGEEMLALTAREFDLLAYLMRNPRQAFSRDDLLKLVWGWTFGDTSTVTVHVRRLREKIEPDPTSPRRIVTVWGVGYRFEPSP